jgi:branched-chain amino acid transport system permease protein
MLIGGLGAMVIGLLVGYPALNRRGLFLGLTTLAAGLVAYEVVFTNLPVFKAQGLKLPRASLFGWSFQGERAYYFFELVCAGLMLLLARNLRSGRMGRILAAMRDSEVAAQSIGIELRRYKLFIFSVSAFMAGIGGTMLTQQGLTFSADQYHPLNSSLLWFAAVIVAGVDSLLGAIVGAAVLTLLGVVWHTPGASQLVIALGALFIAYVPGGSLVGMGRRVVDALRRPGSLQQAFAQAAVAPRGQRGRGNGLGGPAVNGAANGRIGEGLVPTPMARKVLGEARR